jgi:hypothetical protein
MALEGNNILSTTSYIFYVPLGFAFAFFVFNASTMQTAIPDSRYNEWQSTYITPNESSAWILHCTTLKFRVQSRAYITILQSK